MISERKKLMISWKNFDELKTVKKLENAPKTDLREALAGNAGAERVAKYSVPMSSGLSYNFAAKQVNDETLTILKELAEEAQLNEKFEALYNGEVINTGEKRMVLHQMTRGQLGKAVLEHCANKAIPCE